MAKGQKRNSREPKKPKTKKPVVAAAATDLMRKGISASISPPKKKD